MCCYSRFQRRHWSAERSSCISLQYLEQRSHSLHIGIFLCRQAMLDRLFCQLPEAVELIKSLTEHWLNSSSRHLIARVQFQDAPIGDTGLVIPFEFSEQAAHISISPYM